MTVTIKRDLGILPADNRVVFSKYDPVHTKALTEVMDSSRMQLPVEPDELTEYFYIVKNLMSQRGYMMNIDTTPFIFNMFWDTLNETEKETFNDEPSNGPVEQAD